MLKIYGIEPNTIPMGLLLEADPSQENVLKYLKGAKCYAAEKSGEIVGACVLNYNKSGCFELYNIAVSPKAQGLGIGTDLLNHVIESERSCGIKRIELGTGTFGYQLTFYQRAGFRVESIVRDFFIEHYDEPIYELGIQHRDMLRLALSLS